MGKMAKDHLARFDEAVRSGRGVELIGGVDEAGRGALAGPVVAACVVLGPGAALAGVNDSKTLSAAQRERQAGLIRQEAAAWSLGWATAAEVDRVNVLAATLLAAGRALAALSQAPQWLITDYLKIINPPCPCEPIVDGDARSMAVAAASILAKVARDRIMQAVDPEYPLYGLAGHKGYGTREHLSALETHGPSTLHRMTFRGVGFFDSAPPIRARRRPQATAGPPPPDWEAILEGPAEALDGRLYLPEVEWGAE